jgi:hypothetical protein
MFVVTLCSLLAISLISAKGCSLMRGKYRGGVCFAAKMIAWLLKVKM